MKIIPKISPNTPLICSTGLTWSHISEDTRRGLLMLWLIFACSYEPCHQKTCLRGFRPGETQTGLLRYRDEILDIETRDIIPSRQRTTKTLIRLRGCAVWIAHLLFAYGINRFSHDVAHILLFMMDFKVGKSLFFTLLSHVFALYLIPKYMYIFLVPRPMVCFKVQTGHVKR